MLVDLVFSGRFPATVLKAIAEVIAWDMAHPDQSREQMQILASLGGPSNDQGHLKEALMRRFPLASYCEPTLLRTRLRRPEMDMSVETEMDHCFIAQHEVLGAIFRTSRETFHRMFGSLVDIQQYWAQYSDADLDADEVLRDHPLRSKPHFRTRCIPLDYHLDGVNYTKSGRTAQVKSFRSRLATLTLSIDTNVLVYCSPEEKKTFVPATDDLAGTVGDLYSNAHWGALACLEGKHPYTNGKGNMWDPDNPADKQRFELAGTEIAGGLFFAFLGTRSDMKEDSDTLRLPRWDSRSAPCHRCHANFEEGVPEANPYYLGHDAYVRTRPKGADHWNGQVLHPHFNKDVGVTLTQFHSITVGGPSPPYFFEIRSMFFRFWSIFALIC